MAKLYLPSNHGPGGIESGPARGEGGSTTLTVSRDGTLMLRACLFLAKARATAASTSLRPSTIFIRFMSKSSWAYKICPPISGPPDFGLARRSRPGTEMRNFDRKTRNIFKGSSPTCQAFTYLQRAESIWLGWSWFKNGPKIAAIWSGSCCGNKQMPFRVCFLRSRRR